MLKIAEVASAHKFLKYRPILLSAAAAILACYAFKIIAILSFNSSIVAWRAKSISGDGPYCIQVAASSPDGYKPAISLSDLDYSRMRSNQADCDIYSLICYKTNNHALPILGNPTGFLNWSYGWLTFRDEARNHNLFVDPSWRPKIVYSPVSHFAQTLR